MIDFGFSISKSSHIQMDDVDLKSFNKLEALNPDIKTCMSCGLCTATCTAGNFTDVSFRQIILMLQRGKENISVLSQTSVETKIWQLMLVLSAIPDNKRC